jgi:O-antigen ligase
MFLVLIPLVLVSVGWFAHDPVTLFASTILLVGALVCVLFFRRGSWKKSWLAWSPFAVVGGYLVSAIVNVQGLEAFYLGGYQRNFGVATWFALALIFLIGAQGETNVRGYLDWILPSVLVMGILYGFIQFLDKDPLPWSNPYKAVSLTLGNPNFAGAFFGILGVVGFSRFLTAKTLGNKAFGVLLFTATIFISFKTKSLQSPLLIFSGILVFILLYHLGAKTGIALLAKFSAGGILSAGALGIVVLFVGSGSFLSAIREKLFFQGSVVQRLDYWRTGIDIWKDHPIFGVGTDQFQRYAALYRTPTQLKRDGDFVIPDKSHNVLIDHFANGGIMVGLIWIGFVFSIFYMLMNSIRKNENIQARTDLAILGTIWSTYILQALISPDQIHLALIGYSSAGLIAGIFLKNSPTFKIDPFITRSITSFVLVLVLVISGKALIANVDAKKVLGGQITGVDSVLKVIDAWPNPKTTELIGIQEVNKPNNCQFADQISDRLLKYDNRSAQGWYLKAACFNGAGDYNSALIAVRKSVKFDPINPSYLLGKVKIEINSGQKQDAAKTLTKLKSLKPEIGELAALEASISVMK